MSVRLVTRADDAGTTRTTNRAIRAAARDGIVRNVSLMAPAPEIEHAAETLLELGETIDFGLHVTLVCEWQNLRWGPVSDPSAVGSLLRRDGTMSPTVSDLNLLRPRMEELLLEVEAQYDRLRSLGFTLRYLDEHLGVGAINGLGEQLERFAAGKGLVCDRSLHDSRRLVDLPGWHGPAEHPGTELADFLAGVPAGTYLLVGHPGFKEEEMQLLRLPGHEAGEAALMRNRDRRMFMDIEIVDYCQNVGIELLRYSELGTSTPP